MRAAASALDFGGEANVRSSRRLEYKIQNAVKRRFEGHRPETAD